MKRYHVLFAILLIACQQTPTQKTVVKDVAFQQEYHVPYPVGTNTPENDVRSVIVDFEDNIWAACAAGIYKLDKTTSAWRQLMPPNEQGPAYNLAIDEKGVIWIAAWNGLYRSINEGIEKVSLINDPMAAVATFKDQIYAFKHGIKNLYYCNTPDGDGETEKNMTSDIDDDSGCAGGACSI